MNLNLKRILYASDLDFCPAACLMKQMVSREQFGMMSAGKELGVFKLGVPKPAQKGKCGPIQLQHEFPRPLCEGGMFLRECHIIFEVIVRKSGML